MLYWRNITNGYYNYLELYKIGRYPICNVNHKPKALNPNERGNPNK